MSSMTLVLNKFNIRDAQQSTMLLHPSTNLVKIEKTLRDYHAISYCQAIGKLLYIAITSHFDITFTVTYFSYFISTFGCTHWEAAKGLTGKQLLHSHFGFEATLHTACHLFICSPLFKSTIIMCTIIYVSLFRHEISHV